MSVTTDFHTQIKVTKADRARLTKYLGNWRTAHGYVSTLEDTPENVDEIAVLLNIELTNPLWPREHIIKRLHMSLNRMRGRVEYDRMMSNVGKNHRP